MMLIVLISELDALQTEKDVLKVQLHVLNTKELFQFAKISLEIVSNAGVNLLQLLITVEIEYAQIILVQPQTKNVKIS